MLDKRGFFIEVQLEGLDTPLDVWVTCREPLQLEVRAAGVDVERSHAVRPRIVELVVGSEVQIGFLSSEDVGRREGSYEVHAVSLDVGGDVLDGHVLEYGIRQIRFFRGWPAYDVGCSSLDSRDSSLGWCSRREVECQRAVGERCAAEGAYLCTCQLAACQLLGAEVKGQITLL